MAPPKNANKDKPISIAVFGAGVMGASIAAHCANAGAKVYLYDMPPKDKAGARNQIAATAIAKLAKQNPAPFAHASFHKRVQPLCLADKQDLAHLKECSWVIEAVIEDLAIKQKLYKDIHPFLDKGAALTSNTSSLPLAVLKKGMDKDLARRFFITHFFNPPRYMDLLEITKDDAVDSKIFAKICDFADHQLGKWLVDCKDSPGFIANRLGVYWIDTAIRLAASHGLTIEDADAIMGRPVGIPKTGVFGLSDLVGLDLMPHIFAAMKPNLPASDPLIKDHKPPALLQDMIKAGNIGRKSGKGFYGLDKKPDGAKQKLAIDLQTGEYRPAIKPAPEIQGLNFKRLPSFMKASHKYGQFARDVLLATLAYAAHIAPQAAFDIAAVDQAMKLGYRWKYGPFEMMDKLGLDLLADALQAVEIAVPDLLARAQKAGGFYKHDGDKLQILGFDGKYQTLKRKAGILLLEDIKRTNAPLIKNGSAALWDIGEGVVCLEFTGKMNALDTDVFTLMKKAIRLVKSDYKAMVIYNEGSHFSVGANLGIAAFAANIAAWGEVENLIASGQDAYKALKYAPFPVVGAPAGMALGGGCEVLLHCDQLEAHLESYIGLVEVAAGLVPAWGGCKEMLARWAHKPPAGGYMPGLIKVFQMLSTATVAKSAYEAKDHRFLRGEDGITMNRARLLFNARARALALVKNYSPPEVLTYHLAGPTGKLAMMIAAKEFHKQGKATAYDMVVVEALAEVLSGRDTDFTEVTSEDDILALELEYILKLIHNPGTQARITHLLDTGKPLRN